jgi:hypothetical protein
MQAEILSSFPSLNEGQQKLIAQLNAPFDPNDVSSRVTNKTRDGKSGQISFYADPRAYTDRLNSSVTAAGWTRAYNVYTVSPLTRLKKDKAIQTGKIIVTCTVTIPAIGTHCGTGEEWADDDNAMTRAEAQAFKRACSCFGLGRYFYDFGQVWVDLDANGNPKTKPQLPSWALPAKTTQPPAARTAPAEAPKQVDVAKAEAPATQNQPFDPRLTPWIEHFRETLGEQLYMDSYVACGPARKAADLPHQRAQECIIDYLETAERGIIKARHLAEQVGEQRFASVLDRNGIPSLTKVPSLKALVRLVSQLQEEQPVQSAA